MKRAVIYTAVIAALLPALVSFGYAADQDRDKDQTRDQDRLQTPDQDRDKDQTRDQDRLQTPDKDQTRDRLGPGGGARPGGGGMGPGPR